MNRYRNGPRAPYPDVASHMPVIWSTWQPFLRVYEFGAGAYSTPLLAKLSQECEAVLYTGENDARWIPKPHYESHVVGSVASAMLSLEGGERTLAFIDCEAELRASILAQSRSSGIEYVIVHDTEPMQENAYKTRAEFSNWEHRALVRCPFSYVCTTVVCAHEFDPDIFRRLASLTDEPLAHVTLWREIEKFLKG